jgi:hypothetical protein
MQTKIHIVEFTESNTIRIIQDHELKKNKTPYQDDYILEKEWFDDGEYSFKEIPVLIKQTFLVITKGHFIKNDQDSSKLNAYYISGGFKQVNRLAYSYSVNVILCNGNWTLYENDLVYSEAGIKSTKFDMYSYHRNEPEQIYLEDRLDYEVWDSLNFYEILKTYLPVSDIRDNRIDKLLDND